MSTAPAIAIGIMFLGGATLGILVTSAALWRSRAVPRGAAVLIVVFFIVDAPLSQPLIGHLIALVAARWIARRSCVRGRLLRNLPVTRPSGSARARVGGRA